MASIVQLEAAGRGSRLALLAVDFIPEPGGKRFRARLGRCPALEARRYAEMVDRLIRCSRLGVPADDDVIAWASRLNTRHRDRLERAGLLRKSTALSRQPTLRRVCAAYLRARRRGVSPATLEQMVLMVRSITGFMGDPRIDQISRADAAAWWGHMRGTLSEATARGRVRYASVMFGAGMHGAVGLGLLRENPLDQLPRQAVERDKDDVERARVLAVMEVCTPPMRLTLALARFAGLRVPSETRALTWDRVDFERRAMRVRDRKRGRDRMVPIDPTLLDELARAFAAAGDGATEVVTGPGTAGCPNAYIERAMARAGVQPWAPVFHALRGSCATDWLDQGNNPHDVAAWTGHSLTVLMRHYAKVRPANMERVTGGKAQRKAQQGVRDGDGLTRTSGVVDGW